MNTIKARLYRKLGGWRHFAVANLSRAGLSVTADMRALRNNRDRHAGRVGFLIGSGPSVRVEDLDALSGRIGFCCNRFFLAYPTMRFRPTYLVGSDRQMIDDFGAQMVTNGECPVWFVDERRPTIDEEFYWIRSNWSRPFRFFRDVRMGAGVGGATLIAATQIGYHLGIRHFFLYGVDHSFKFQTVATPEAGLKIAQGDGNHFIANYRSGKAWIPPKTELIEEGFKVCDQELRKEGGWIKNATRGGALEVLERISFEQALAFPDTARG
jgi:hypothetical protein